MNTSEKSSGTGPAENCQDAAPGRWRTWLRHHRLWILGAVWLGVFILGYIGVGRQFAATGEKRSLLDPFYRVTQLFGLDDSMVVQGAVVAWQLELARFVAPILAAYTAVLALFGLFREQILILRLAFTRNHVVICGLGKKGLQFARTFQAKGSRVVVIEIDDDNEHLATCRELGMAVLMGDATDPALLERAHVTRASVVIAVTGDDGENVEIAVGTYRLVEKEGRRNRKEVHCFAHVVNRDVSFLFTRHQIFRDVRDRFVLTLFNIYQQSARLALSEHFLDRERITADDPRDIRLVIVGFGEMGESLALQAARLGHYANGRKLLITVIDQEAEARLNRLLSRYASFERVCRIEFLTGTRDDREILKRIREWSGDPKCLTTVVVALDDDAQAVSCALNIKTRLENETVPILVRMAEESGLAVLLAVDYGARWGQIKPFGLITQTCTCRALLDEDLDILAKASHQYYVEQRRKEGASESDLSLLPWDQLEETLRDSGRQQADHIEIKLRAIGCVATRPVPGRAAVDAFTPAEVEMLAQMEHRRWIAERLLDGWTSGPRDPKKKTSPYLIDWSELSDNIREYDRQAVRRIPALLGRIGKAIYRDEVPA